MKVVVINGGAESKSLVQQLNLDQPTSTDARVLQCISRLKEAKINLFYKLSTSGETIHEMYEQNVSLSAKNDMLVEKNDLLEKDMVAIKDDLAVLKEKLGIK